MTAPWTSIITRDSVSVDGVAVTLVELKNIQLPESMKRAMAREAEREKRAKIITAEGEAPAFPAPLMSTAGELGSFLARQAGAAAVISSQPQPAKSLNGSLPRRLPGSSP